MIKLYKEYIQTPEIIVADKGYHHVELFMDDVMIDVCGEDEKGIYMSKVIRDGKVYVEFEGVMLDCMRLESTIEAYNEIGRKEKAEFISSSLRNRSQ